MPLLFREFVFCECGRPAMHRSQTCRTCYEDGLRRKWRDQFLASREGTAPVPVRVFNVYELREMAPGDTAQPEHWGHFGTSDAGGQAECLAAPQCVREPV